MGVVSTAIMSLLKGLSRATIGHVLRQQWSFRRYSSIKWSEVHPYNAIRIVLDTTADTVESDLHCMLRTCISTT